MYLICLKHRVSIPVSLLFGMKVSSNNNKAALTFKDRKMDHKRIMVVEDDPGIRDVLEILLTDISEQFFIASTATGFYAELNKYIPDLFIIDIMLPDGNGVDICKDLKNRKSTSDVPIILMSANLTLANVQDCKADLFVHKPFDIKTFVGGAKALLN